MSGWNMSGWHPTLEVRFDHTAAAEVCVAADRARRRLVDALGAAEVAASSAFAAWEGSTANAVSRWFDGHRAGLIAAMEHLARLSGDVADAAQDALAEQTRRDDRRAEWLRQLSEAPAGVAVRR